MNCVITAGPTYEPLDDVRRLTNFSTGRLGTELANFLVAGGHNVTLLTGVQATWPGPREAQTVIPLQHHGRFAGAVQEAVPPAGGRHFSCGGRE